MSDSDDELLLCELPRRRSTRPSSGAADDYKEQAPRLAKFSAAFSVKDLLKEQDQEEKKKEAIRQQAPMMTDDDDMLIDDDELAKLGNGLSDMGDGMGADLDFDNNDDIDNLNAKIKSLKPQRDEEDSELDMENEDFTDWRGMSAVFVMAERNKIRNLEFRSFVQDSTKWGEHYMKLYCALLQAGAKLPDLLCAVGPAKWLAATQKPVPPQLMEWLLHVLALTDDPALARGAFLNVRALLRGPTEELPKVGSELLEGWALPFSTLAKVLEYYGIGLLATSSEGKNRIEFVRKIDTTQYESKTSRVTIPPVLNLSYLLQTIQWLVEDRRIGGVDWEDWVLPLLACTRIMSIDRHVQAGCPRELRDLTGALLQKVPADQWPAPTISNLIQAVLERQDMQLGTDSALQMTRTIGLQSPRERDLIMSFAVHILRRVLPEATESLKDVNVLADPELYLLNLMDLLNNPDLDAMFVDGGAEVTFHTAYCVELLSKALFASKAMHATLYEKLSRFEKTRRHGAREEEAQSTKDILMTECLGLKLFGPRTGVQKKLGFAAAAAGGNGQSQGGAAQN